MAATEEITVETLPVVEYNVTDAKLAEMKDEMNQMITGISSTIVKLSIDLTNWTKKNC